MLNIVDVPYLVKKEVYVMRTRQTCLYSIYILQLLRIIVTHFHE